MARVSSHTLNGVDGTHAGGIGVTLTELGSGAVLFATVMDAGGRLAEDIPADRIDPQATYELVFDTRAYWQARGASGIMDQIVLRFRMAEPEGSYHLPVILSPNAYSMWSSA